MFWKLFLKLFFSAFFLLAAIGCGGGLSAPEEEGGAVAESPSLVIEGKIVPPDAEATP